MFAGILTRYKDDGGDLGVSDEGWKQIEGYFKNGTPAVAKTDLFARIASGDTDMGQMPSSIIPDREKTFNGQGRHRDAVRRRAATPSSRSPS